MVDIDWNSDKVDWSKPHPMNAEENMLKNAQAIQAVDPSTITWVYRNGIKALPWMTTVREKLEDKSYWGWFMPNKGCNPSPGVYTCGPNATTNLYHDFEQTPHTVTAARGSNAVNVRHPCAHCTAVLCLRV
jgi:hypothetical protein